jgi:hypothetical protein
MTAQRAGEVDNLLGGSPCPEATTDTSATGLARTVRAESDYDPHQSAVLL